jgi:DNA-binding winged helix-turn-helix (wHTH) protein
MGPMRLEFDSTAQRFFVNAVELDLSWRHLETLRILADARGRVVAKQDILTRVWSGAEVDESNLTQCIAQLRKVIRDSGGDVDWIETVPRQGYRIKVPVYSREQRAVAPATPRSGWRRYGLAAVVVLASVGAWQWRSIDRARRAEAEWREGNRLRNQRNPLAMDAFRRAIQLEPDRGLYHATLAEAMAQVSGVDAPDWNVALQTAARGVEVDPACAPCRAIYGFILFSRFWRWNEARDELRRAEQLGDASAGLNGYHAMLLASTGEIGEAHKRIGRGLAIDPHAATLRLIATGLLYFDGRYDEVHSSAAQGAAYGWRNPGFADWKSYALFQQHRPEEAVSTVAAAHWPNDLARIESEQKAMGPHAALKLLLSLTEGSASRVQHSYRRAHWKMVLDDPAGAVNELEFGARFRVFPLIYTAVDPMFRPLRGTQRFEGLLAQLHLDGVETRSRGR